MSSSEKSTAGTAQIGVTGLAVMGSNIARNFARHGYTVALHNRSVAKTDALLADHGSEGSFVRSETIPEFLAALEKPRRVLIMVKAGDATDAVINELADAMEEGDIIIDGGNALYTDTIRREKAIRERGLHFVGAGISGGEEGALNGPSIMPGGPAESYESLGPLLEEISAHVDGVPCCTHIGPDGAGHFVKMVHNGIEYSDMQLIGEAYQLLRDGLGKTAPEIADVFDEWNKGDLDSFLVEITAQVLRQTDAKTGKPLVDLILDEAEQKGTGRWTVKSALDLGVPVTGIAEAVFARALSGSVAQRAIWARSQAMQTDSSRTSARPCTRRRSSRTPRASTRSRQAAPNTTGISPPATWPRSGAAAASSGRSSSTGSKTHSTPTPNCPA
jgi:6-phosphogluconate dehydrogenase